MSLFKELKRRNVFKVGIAYIVMAWLVMQVADVILNNVEAPGWVFHVLLLFLAVGFPLAIFFAWAFELTPDGLKREHEVDRSQSITQITGRKLDFFIIGTLVIVAGYFIWEARFAQEASDETFSSEAVQEQATTTLSGSPNSESSVAVLPFINMSADAEKEYFSDGITEEIINALVKIPGLSVSARTSVFGFKGHQGDVREVGASLGVTHILEGSIRSQGNLVRITAQLIKVDDGFHLWSETFDRKLENIFAVQEEIASAIAKVLVGELGVGVQAVPNRTRNMKAYDLYLHGRAALRRRDEEAIVLLQQATRADPHFAPAWAALAIAYQVQGYRGDYQGYQQKAEVTARHALALDPENVDALDALASVLRDTWQWAESEKYFETALAIDPQSSELLEDYAEFLVGTARFDEMLAVAERAYSIDSNLRPLVDVYRVALVIQGRFGEAIALIDRLDRTDADFGSAWKLPTFLAAGDAPSAISFLESLDEATFPEELSPAMIRLLRNPDDKDARDVLRQRFSSENYSIHQGRSRYVRQVLAFSGDVDYVLDTLLALYSKAGWGNAEEIWDPNLASVRQLPQFSELLEFLNLPGYWDSKGWPEICNRGTEAVITCR